MNGKRDITEKALERAQLARLLKKRSEGEFISGAELDARLAAMVETKRRKLMAQK